MDEITNPQNLEYIIAIVTGASIPMGIACIGYKIRERLFELDIARRFYNDGVLKERPTFWNIRRLSPFNPRSEFYRNKPMC